MQEYCYSPLTTPTSIRLLRIDKEDPIGTFHCSLKIVDLKDSPWYHAFSYTWGNPHAQGRDGHDFSEHYNATDADYSAQQKKSILCDGKVIHINRNLYDAFCDVPKGAWRKQVNKKTEKEGFTRLHIHAINGNLDGVLHSIYSGAELDATDNIGATALNWAARSGHLGVVKLLVESGADLSIENEDKTTALDYSQTLHNTEMKEYLMNPQTPIEASALGDGPEVWAWIDQICINQSDVVERSSQVGLMGQIYSKATFTLIWLGKEDPWTKGAVSAISKLVGSGEQFVNSNIIPYSKNTPEVFHEAGIQEISADEWKSIAALFQRQYFRRLWIIQENLLSNIILGYCGNIEIPWKDFCVVAQLLGLRQKKIGRSISASYIPLNEAARAIEDPAIQLVQWKERLSDKESTNPRLLSLENLVFDTWNFRSTDPRDKIYGIYGLLHINSSEPVDWSADYEKSAGQVFAEATKRIFEEAGMLWMLSAVLDHSFRNIDSLPSWVPDYSLSHTNMMCGFFSAAGNLPKPSLIFSSSVPWNFLRVKGAQIDTILKLGCAPLGHTDSRYFFDPSWLDLTLLLPCQYHTTDQRRTEALWRTLCANQTVKSEAPAPLLFAEGFHNAVNRMLVRAAWIEEQEYHSKYNEENLPPLDDPKLPSPSLQYAVNYVQSFFEKPPFSTFAIADMEAEFSNPGHSFLSDERRTLVYTLLKLHILSLTEELHASTPPISGLLEIQEELEEAKQDPMKPLLHMGEHSEFITALHSRKGRRRLFVTEKRFLGLGPRGMEVGDEIWVLPGSGAAFVLRKLEGSEAVENCERYKFIGETYIHGIMNGEAVEGQHIELKDIILE